MTIQLGKRFVAVLHVLIMSSPLFSVSPMENVLLLAPAINPFCFQVSGSNIRFFTYKALMIALVF